MTASAAAWLGSLALVGAAIFVAAAALDRCLRRRSAAVRREVWALAIVVALVLPLPRLALAGAGLARSLGAAAARFFGAAAARPFGAAAALLLVWASGALLLLLRLVRAHVLARGRRARAAPLLAGPWPATLRELAGDRRVELRRCAEIRAPQVVGVLRPAILVPPALLDAPAAERRALLAHELAHVARADNLLLLAGGLVRAIHWPDPLAWWALRRLRAHAEDAADDAALHTGIPSSSYAAQLVAVARDQLERAGRVAADGLRARVRGVLDARRARSLPLVGPRALPRLVAAALLLATMVTACEARSDEAPRAAAASR